MANIELRVVEHRVPTDDGWTLKLRQTYAPSVLDPTQRPLLIVPGYGMNSFIFSYHPRGTSMERSLAEAGLEVWAVDLRGQGGSLPTVAKREAHISLERYARGDLPPAVRFVRAHTRTTAKDLVLVGCSLGGSIAYGYLATTPDHGVGEVIAMGAPLRWDEAHPVLKLAFASEAVAGALRMSNTRQLVRAAMPLLRRMPALLSIYMNTSNIDLDRIGEMAQTVEDPHPRVNRDIARWLRDKDLELDGVNVTEGMRAVSLPLLVVLSNRDGIVPAPSALSVTKVWGSREVEVLEVGDERDWYAHANLFIANCAPERVFKPIVRWLRRPPFQG